MNMISNGKDKMDPDIFTIGELSYAFDVTHRTLRYYEDKGLISPIRRGNTRLYTRRDRARLRLVLMGKKVGFSLEEIKEMLDLYDLKDGQLLQLKSSLEKFNKQIDNLNTQKLEIENAINELSRNRDIVEGMLREKEKAQNNPDNSEAI